MLRVLVAIAAAGAVYAILIERHWFALRRFTVPCLPAGATPLRLLHLSDLHFRRGQRLKRRFLARLRATSPDIVVVTGDFLGDAKSVHAVVAALEPIRARTAAMFVLGSNDYYEPAFRNPLGYLFGASRPHRKPRENPWHDLVHGLVEQGWRYYSNRAEVIGSGGFGSGGFGSGAFEVVGLDDAHIGRAKPDVATARTGDTRFRLAIAHSPDSARDLLSKGYDLVLCGHTHGGQVCLPFYGALVTNCDIPRAWARGLHRSGDAFLHVSAGLGTSMFAPYRFACRPEVSLLELVPRDLASPGAAPPGVVPPGN